MNESISNAMVFMIVIVVISVSAGIVLYSMGYSKTYKIKDKVIDIIELNSGYRTTANGHSSDNSDAVRDEIEAYLRTVGYTSDIDGLNVNDSSNRCPQINGKDAVNELRNYKYCIYEEKTVKGSYYTVKVYMTYNIPLIGDFFKLRYSITGDSRVIFEY